MACYNPLLADERDRKRQELLAATEKDLRKIAAQVGRRTRTPMKETEIALKVGKVINHYKMGKHFELSMEDGRFCWQRREESIRQEQQLDGIYVLRTSESAGRAAAAVVVRSYKSLAHVERAFRCLKGLDLRVRPIHHRLVQRVRAHFLVCMLAYYVQWHMRKGLAPLLFEDEHLDAERLSRDPVAAARPSRHARRKKQSRQTEDGLPLHSFQTLLRELATRCRNHCRLKADPAGTHFTQVNPATPLQARAFELLGL